MSKCKGSARSVIPELPGAATGPAICTAGFRPAPRGRRDDPPGEEARTPVRLGTTQARFVNGGISHSYALNRIEYAFEPVPEPATLLLVGAGLAGCARFRSARRTQSRQHVGSAERATEHGQRTADSGKREHVSQPIPPPSV